MGSSPYLGGGFGHFFTYAPNKMEYPIDRFAMEVKRQLDVIDRQLSSRSFIIGNDYTIADIAILGLVWAVGPRSPLQSRRISRCWLLQKCFTLGQRN